MHVKKLYSDDSCPIQLQSSAGAGDLQLAGIEWQMDGKLRVCSSVSEVEIVRICQSLSVCVAPLMIVGVWFIAVMQFLEYYS